MNLKVLHTADWHLGQNFYEYDRTAEHLSFLDYLKKIIKEQEIDVLLICGDIFDVSNPSTSSISILYKFLIELTTEFKYLQNIIIGGNHDSASRLELPNPILEHLNIRIIGKIQKNENGDIISDKLIIPLKNKNSEIQAYCIAVPFIRPGEISDLNNTISTYSEGITKLYSDLLNKAESIKTENQAIIAMGHLHTMKAEISENDKNERLILGGIELINLQNFENRITYFALGHLHKPQKVSGIEHFRYSGSPLPMSFSEKNYHHQVVVIEFDEQKAKKIESIEIPRLIDLLKIPQKHAEINIVLEELNKIETIQNEDDKILAPYLEVRILLKEPEPNLRNKIEKQIENKKVKLAKIDIQYLYAVDAEYNSINSFNKELQNLNPLNILENIFQTKFKSELPEKYKILFNKALSEIEK